MFVSASSLGPALIALGAKVKIAGKRRDARPRSGEVLRGSA